MSYRADRKAMKGNQVMEAVLTIEEEDAGRAIVVGHGPTGRQVASALTDQGLVPVVIDMNVDTVNDLTSQGRHAVFGDSSKKEVLHAAGVEKARYLVVTLPDVSLTAATVAAAMGLNPDLRVLVRARFIKDKALLCSMGVSAVAFEEEEVAKTLANLVLDDLKGTLEGACELPSNEDAD